MTQTQLDWNAKQTTETIAEAIRTFLESNNISHEYVAPRDHLQNKIPKTFCWIACYVVTGTSEGQYINVDLIADNGDRVPVCFIKTLYAKDKAVWDVVADIAEFLGA